MQNVLVIFGSVIVALFLIYGIATMISDGVSSYNNRRKLRRTSKKEFIGAPRIVKKSCSDITIRAFIGTDVNDFLKNSDCDKNSITLHNIRAECTGATKSDYKLFGGKIYHETKNGMLSKYGELFSPEDAVKDFVDNYEVVRVHFEAEE